MTVRVVEYDLGGGKIVKQEQEHVEYKDVEARAAPLELELKNSDLAPLNKRLRPCHHLQ